MSHAFRFINPANTVVLRNPSADHLLRLLCMGADSETGESYYSQAGIYDYTGMIPKTVRKATQALVNLGLVTVKSLGRNRSLRYFVHYKKLVELAKVGKAIRAKHRAE